MTPTDRRGPGLGGEAALTASQLRRWEERLTNQRDADLAEIAKAREQIQIERNALATAKRNNQRRQLRIRNREDRLYGLLNRIRNERDREMQEHPEQLPLVPEASHIELHRLRRSLKELDELNSDNAPFVLARALNVVVEVTEIVDEQIRRDRGNQRGKVRAA